MKIEQTRWNATAGFQPAPPGKFGDAAHLVLLFGCTSIIKDQHSYEQIRAVYPNAYLMGCSTAGEICATQVTDDSLVITAIHFEHSRIQGALATLDETRNSYQAGEKLARSLDRAGLAHVFVLSEGLHVNGSELVRGLTHHLPPKIAVTGGLSGDGPRFQETYVVGNNTVRKDAIVALGLYGDRLHIGYGSQGGWDPFGPERLVTQSRGNVLFQLDGKSALELYKRYLGDHAQGLPATGLLFPLSIRIKDGISGLVRTILSVDEKEKSMTFAGDIPEGSYARLMKANLNRLIDGAAGAAERSRAAMGSVIPKLAILISCVGRKMVMKQRTEEEIEAVREVLGSQTILTGFYSYGEISPFAADSRCALHNQTMTITTITEA